MAERDWLRTVRQSVPQLARVLRHLGPTWELDRVDRLDPAFCATHGVRGLIWDVDGTLTTYHGREIEAGIRPAVLRLLEAPELRHVILSNCGEARFVELGGIIPGVPVLKAYRSADGVVRRCLLGGVERWDGGGPAPDLVPIRKPSAELVTFALDELGVAPAEAVMVGDQYWTDVAGAGMAGVRSVKLPTLAPATFPQTLRVLQRFERVLHRAVGGRPGG